VKLFVAFDYAEEFLDAGIFRKGKVETVIANVYSNVQHFELLCVSAQLFGVAHRFEYMQINDIVKLRFNINIFISALS
jgi:hypothetical protein